MLMMTVKEGEYLMIGDNVCIQIIKDLSAKSMRIGIDAPKSVKIVRGKPYETTLLEDSEKNADILKKLESQKQLAALIRQRVSQKEKNRKSRRRQKTQEESIEKF